MSQETADRSIFSHARFSIAARYAWNCKVANPLLAFDTIQYLVPKAKNRHEYAVRVLDIVVTTNLACATDEMLTYFRDEGVESLNVSRWSGIPSQQESPSSG